MASLFISLHHNISGIEATRETPKGEPFLYESGWKDACSVFFYSLVCIVMHAIVQEYLLDVSSLTILQLNNYEIDVCTWNLCIVPTPAEAWLINTFFSREYQRSFIYQSQDWVPWMNPANLLYFTL